MLTVVTFIYYFVFLMTDTDLVTKAIAGCKDSFTILWVRHRHFVKMLTRKIVADRAHAEDVVQDVAVILVRKLHTFGHESDFKSWLYRVTYNTALQHLRKAKKQKLYFIEDVEAEFNMPEGSITPKAPEFENGYFVTLQHEIGLIIARSIKQLPNDQRAALSTYIGRDLELDQVARRLKKSVPSIKSLVHRARIEVWIKLHYASVNGVDAVL